MHLALDLTDCEYILQNNLVTLLNFYQFNLVGLLFLYATNDAALYCPF